MSTASPALPLALSVDDAAEQLGIARVTLARRIKDGTIRAVKIGTRTVVPVSELQRILAGLPRPAVFTGADYAAIVDGSPPVPMAASSSARRFR